MNSYRFLSRSVERAQSVGSGFISRLSRCGAGSKHGLDFYCALSCSVVRAQSDFPHCTLVILSTVFQSNYDSVLIGILCKNLQNGLIEM